MICDFVADTCFRKNVNDSTIDASMLELVGKHNFIDTIRSWIRRIIAKFQKADSDVEKQIRIELIKIQDAIEQMYKQSQKQGFADDEVKYSKDVDKSHTSYDKPITARDIEKLRSIGKKSINDFIAEDLQKVQKWAYKFYKELNIKSPFFRAWFGDWRAYDTSPAYVVSFAYGENKKLNYTKRSVRCDELNANIIVDETVINDSLSYAKKNGDEKQIRKLLGKVDDILSMGILLDTQVSQKNTGHKKGSTQFMHYLYTPISINGAPFVAKLCIEEYGFNESKRAYNLQRLKISEVSRAQYSQLIDENRGKYAYTSDALSVAQLFEFVKQKDKKFKPNPVNQVLLNEDGTPKVFYHGTRENFTEFSKKKVKPGFYGRGFYFTTEKTQSNVYGESMEVFLRIENPLMPNGNKITLNQIVRFLEAIAENEDYSIENYGTYDINEIASRITNRDVFSVIQDINATAIGDFGEAMQLFNVVNGTNFDGVITPTETVVYDNTQIKSATDNIGTFDKSDPNIRYSLDIDTSKMTASEFVKSLGEKYHAKFDANEVSELAVKAAQEVRRNGASEKGIKAIAKIADTIFETGYFEEDTESENVKTSLADELRSRDKYVSEKQRLINEILLILCEFSIQAKS